ncbi:O-antigen ligase family protein [Marinobacter sp. CHS3-4]|uniref:O-antigen ligase family protein n=1 Tax=Marinobacter sp. CHS3-4 TaxID=3045174 RepID=UPI0024B59AB0|nr:O-antigen ligase family protein [Marinobacter sp. CHS3-4]MDI9245578.1 O-antigen ligase family protein [Marinobacter sp. CHS3-4]
MDGLNRREHAKLKKRSRNLYILLAFLFFEYVRLQDSYLGFLAPFKIPALMNLLLLGVVFVYFRDLPKDRLIYLIIAFWVLILLHVPFATNNYHAFNAAKAMFLTSIVVLATVILVDTESSLKKLFESMIYIVLLVSIWVILNGGKGPGGFVGDENDVCLFLVVGVPFCWYFPRLTGDKQIKRWIALGTGCLAIIAIVMTSSRGGFLGLVAVVGTILLFSRKPVRNILLSVLLAGFLGGMALNFVPNDYVADMRTISDKQNSTRNLRFLHWTTAWEIYKDNPVFGVGPQNYPWTSARYFHLSPFFQEGARGRSGRQSHSLYFTLIPEMGTFGILVFLALTVSFYRRGLRIRSFYKKRYTDRSCLQVRNKEEMQRGEVIERFAKALLVAMSGFLISATFISVLYYPVFWNLLGFSIATWWVFLKTENLPHTPQGKPKTGSIF